MSMVAHNIPADFQTLRPMQLSGPPQDSKYEGFELGTRLLKSQAQNWP